MIFGLTLVHIPSVSSMIFDEETENDRLACLELLALVFPSLMLLRIYKNNDPSC